jgi:predicted HTH transcriptional regulator
LKGELEKIILEEKEGTQGHPNLFEAGKESIKEESEKAETEENKGNPSGVIQLPPFSSLANLERQEKIMAFLKEQGRAQVWQIKQILPEVTKRTLRRDFDNLLKKGLVERIGERNNTFYQIKIIQL